MNPVWYVNAVEAGVTAELVNEVGPRAAAGDREALSVLGATQTPDRSGNNRTAIATDGQAGPVPAESWNGDVLLGQWDGIAGSVWPTSQLDFEWTGWIHPSRRSRGEWTEMFLSTVDEVSDYLEPGFVHRDGGYHFGLDLDFDGRERNWVSEAPIPSPVGPANEASWRLQVDGASGDVRLFRNDEPVLEDRVDFAPFTFPAPPVGSVVTWGRNQLATRSGTLREHIDGPTIISIAADDTSQWTERGGMKAGPFPTSRFVRGNNSGGDWEVPSIDIAANQSFTWALKGRFWPGNEIPWWSAGIDNLQGDGSGWILVSNEERGFGFAFLLRSAGGPLLGVDAGQPPQGDSVVLIELDRDEGQLRMRIDGRVAATEDASKLGAISDAGTMSFASGYGDHEWYAQFPRLLNADERAAL